MNRTKGANSVNGYRPKAGDRCLVSPPNADNADGYVYFEFDILWCNAMFVVYGKDGCWPVVNKWDHVSVKELPRAKGTT